MKRQLRHLALYCLFIALGCVHGAVFAAITNQASVSYADQKSSTGASARASNEVKTFLPEAISYYTSANYTAPAMVAGMNQRLYVQATSAECNADPDAVETITIAMTSRLSGDTEDYRATETAPDSGMFRIMSTVAAVDASQPAAGADSPGVVAGDGSIAVAKNDTLTATIKNCGSGKTFASVLIDPSGVVFDSKTGLVLAGATVTLIDVTGAGNGGLAGGPARVFRADGVTPASSTYVTLADGVYRFPLVAASLYRLVVTPPSNYTFPSKVAPGALPGDHTIHLYGSFGADFVVSASTGPVVLDVPLDPIPGTLYLEKTASRSTADVGDFVDYTVRVHNTAEQPLVGVTVTDELPAGFSLVPGSVKLEGAPVADPAGGRGPTLQFAIGSVPATGSVALRYRARIGGGALQGDGINRAHATSGAPLIFTSVIAAAKVKVSAGVFSEKGYIVGQVYADCDGNGVRDENEPGVPGVRIYLEDGSFSQTDAEGRYSFADLRPRTHVAKVDGATLPAGAQLKVLSNRNSFDAGSRFVDLHDGELAKADFALDACTPAVRDAIKARGTALKDAERRAAAVAHVAATTAPVAGAAKAAVSLDTLDSTLGFVDLLDGTVLPGANVKVRVKGGAGATFTLRVNGVTVPDQHIGQRSTVAARQLEVWEFVGVNLRPGENVLDVAQVDSFGNPRGSHAVKVIAPGRLAKIRVSLDKPSFPADGKAIALVHVQLEDANGVAVTERTALTLDASRGEWQKPDLDPRAPGLQLFVEGGAADVPLRAPFEAGEAAVKVAAGTLAADTRADFVPDLRPLVAAGLFDGAISLRSISGNTAAPKRDFDGFEDQLRHFSGNASGGSTVSELGARGAFFAKGKVADNTLLTMSYDSDKAVETPLFRDLDPTAYYPTYGDSAQRGFDAQSTGRLYLRADRDKSWLLYGDYTPPGVTPARNLGAYNRSLNGLRHHYEKNGLTIDSFASHDTTRQVVTEFAANGTSGPFLTGAGAMVINSERIELITRDRNQPGILLATRAQTRWADYDIEPLTGRILFRAPVASLDADLNPVTIRISYEIDQGSAAFWVGGTAAQYKVTEKIEVGGSYVDDRNPVAATSLASVNATVKPDENTVVTVEAAQMDKMGALDKGRAARIDATRRDGKLESHVYAGRADVNFDNPAASLPKGRAEAGVRATYRVDEHISFGGEVIHSADLTTGAARDGVQLTGGYAFGDGLRAEIGLRQSHEVVSAAAENTTVVAQPALTSVRAKVAAQVPGLPQAGVYVEGEQDVRDSARRMVALGGDYRLAGGSRLYGRHELISSLGSNYALNDGQQRNATVFGVDSDYMKDGRVFTEYRARGATQDGRQAEAALGLRNLWNVADGVRVNTTFERVKVLSGSAANEAIAVTGAIELNRSNDFKANARLELRHAEDSDNLLNTLGMAYRLTDTWSLLGKNTLAVSRSRSTDSMRVAELLQTGVAYRALATLGWNGLAKYEYKLDSDNGIAATKRGVHSVAVSANYQPIRETVFTARYAAKIVRDRSNGLDSRSLGHLVGGRVTHEVSRKWDVGATAQMMLDGGTRSRQFGAGLEAGYQVRTNTWVSAGYNFLGFREPDLAGADATARGAYVRLRMKFDERTLASVLTAPVL